MYRRYGFRFLFTHIHTQTRMKSRDRARYVWIECNHSSESAIKDSRALSINMYAISGPQYCP